MANTRQESEITGAQDRLIRESGEGSVDRRERGFSNPVTNLGLRARSLVRRPMLRLYSLEGNYGDGRLRVLVADDGSTLSYIQSVAFPDGADIKRKGAICSYLAPRLSEADADLVVIGANHLLLSLYKGRSFSFVPKWVRLFIPIWGDPDTMLKALPVSGRNSVERMVRRARNNGFTYEVTTDPAWFDTFYYDMYVPHAQKRFSELAALQDYHLVKKAYHRGMGLIVKQNEDVAGGVIILRRPNILYFYRVGTMNGDENWNKQGASTALYYYTISLAHSLGCKGVDFGHSRPFLSDGVLQYKLKWGMQVLNVDDSIGIFAIAAPGRTDQATKFLSDNPFYQYTSKGIKLCNDF